MKASCFVFGAGPFYGLAAAPKAEDTILAADGGLKHCQALGLTPDLVLGDFDSLGSPPKTLPTETFPVEKDDTDMMLALKTGMKLGFHTFHLYGGTGGRMDHTLANLQALAYLAQHGARGYLYDKSYAFTAIYNSSITLPSREEGIFSVFCMGPEPKEVSILGGQYGGAHVPLSPFFPLGVSNHFQGKPVTITVETGCLLIGWELPS